MDKTAKTEERTWLVRAKAYVKPVLAGLLAGVAFALLLLLLFLALFLFRFPLFGLRIDRLLYAVCTDDRQIFLFLVHGLSSCGFWIFYTIFGKKKSGTRNYFTLPRRNCSIISAVRLKPVVSSGTSCRSTHTASDSSSSCTVRWSSPSSSA